MTKIPKIAVYISGGVLQGVGSDLEVELVDEDNESEEAGDRWEEVEAINN